MNNRLSTVLLSLTIAQSAISGPATAQSRGSLNALLHELHAQDWTARAAAVDRLTDNPDMWHAPATKRALIQLLDRENRPLTDGNQPHRSEQEWEAWRRYYDQLVDHVADFVEPGDVRSVSVLVRSSYNPDSPLAVQLASYGQTVVPALLDIIANRDPEGRSDSYEVLGRVLRAHRLGTSRYPLSAKAALDVENVLRAGLHDPAPFIRGSAIRGVKAAGDVSSLPILDELRTSDPYVLGGTQRFWIREQAAKAIADIQAHPLSK
jgi:hypothetical protein